MNQIENVWVMCCIVSLLSLIAISVLVANVRASIAALKQASVGHHMIQIRGAHQALTVDEEVEYIQGFGRTVGIPPVT